MRGFGVVFWMVAVCTCTPHTRTPTPTIHTSYIPYSSPHHHTYTHTANRTMLHELVHNEIGEHSDKFYTRLEGVLLSCVRVCILPFQIRQDGGWGKTLISHGDVHPSQNSGPTMPSPGS